MGGGKKRGVENLTNDTPPRKGFWTTPRMVRFPPPSGVSALFFLYKDPQQSRPEALLEGSKNFRESTFSGSFSSPHTFCTPHITAQKKIATIFGPQKLLTLKVRPALSRGMDWWRMEWPFFRVRKYFQKVSQPHAWRWHKGLVLHGTPIEQMSNWSTGKGHIHIGHRESNARELSDSRGKTKKVRTSR